MHIRKMSILVATVACSITLAVSTGVMAETSVAKKDSTSSATVQHLKPQTTCPVMGGAIDKTQYVDVDGKRIYVCCGGCIAQVKSDPDAAIKKLASMGQEPETIVSAKAVKNESKAKTEKKPATKRAD